jgi:WS/DGAT/MGAT family acyltransferase
MRRLSGQDASFLYTETPTVLMHTLKIQILETVYDGTEYDILRERLEATLDVVPMLRQRVMFVPFNLHHPVMVDDPDFDLGSHIYRAALPAPGGDRELNQMISQIMCHRLDRQRPLWELWLLTGLANGQVAIVHKVHHCLADGAATVRYLSHAFEYQMDLVSPVASASTWQATPLPSGYRLVWRALTDHLKHDIRTFPSFIGTMWRVAKRLLVFNRDVGSPTVKWLTNPPPRTRLNHVLSARRSFTRRQLPLADVKQLAHKLGGTVNDVILALVAAALRDYLQFHNGLPKEPLATAIPVSAEEADEMRESGNHTSYLPTCLWTNIADPQERFRAIQHSTRLGKQELQVLGKGTFSQLMHFMPPFFTLWKTRRKQRLRRADRPGSKPMTNVIISNVPGPRKQLSGNYGTLVDLYSVGPLVEAVGLNITVWSYAGNLNISIMGCKKAVPDIERLADAMIAAMTELDQLPATAQAEKKIYPTAGEEGR